MPLSRRGHSRSRRTHAIGILCRRMSNLDQAPAFFSRQVLDSRRFQLDLRPNQRRPLAVVCGGWERCATDYRIERKTFPYLVIELVAAGQLSLDLAGRSYDL